MDKNVKGALIGMVVLAAVLGITDVIQSKRIKAEDIIDVKCKEKN